MPFISNNIESEGYITATTISATSMYISGVIVNTSQLNFTGGTITGATNFTGGLSANTISANTYNTTLLSGSIVFVSANTITENNNRFKWDNGNFGLLISSSGITSGATYQLQSPVFVQLDSNDFYHYNIQNRSTGTSASSEYVLTANNGDRDNKFFAVGINNSGFNDVSYSLKGPNSGYLLMNGGDLFIGTQTAHDIVFHTSGTTPTKELLRMKPSGSIIIGGSSATTDNGSELQISGSTWMNGSLSAATISATTIITPNINNEIFVSKLADLPAPILSAITLNPNITYRIKGSIVLGNNYISANTSNTIYGVDKSNDKLIYTGPGAAIRLTNNDLSIRFVTLVSTSGPLFSINNSITNNIQLSDNIFASNLSLGTISGGNYLIIDRNLFVSNSDGFNINGTINYLTYVDNELSLNSGTTLTISSGTFTNISIIRNIINVPMSQVGLNISSGLTLTNGILGQNVFIGSGTSVTGINNTTTNWLFNDNTNIANGLSGLFVEPYNISPAAVTVPTAAVCTTVITTSVTGQLANSYLGTADQNANTTFRVPDDYFSNGRFRVFLSPATTVGGVNIVFAPIATIKGSGSTMNTITETLTPQTIASGTAHIMVPSGWFTFATTLVPKQLVSVRLTRPASSNAADTYTGALLNYGFEFEYFRK